MRHFLIILVLVMNVALVKPQWGISNWLGGMFGGTGGLSASGGVQIGGCSVGASGSGSAALSGGGASGSASVVNCATPKTGYTYEINATRTLNIVGQDDAVVNIYYKVSPTQNITYLRSLGPNYPLMIQAYILTDYNLEYANDKDSLLNLCDNFANDDWPYVAVEIVKKSVMPGGNCSVMKGNYTIYEHVGTISVTFPKMIYCGEYEVRAETFVAPTKEDLSKHPDIKLIRAYLFYYTFKIPENGNCIKPKRASE